MRVARDSGRFELSVAPLRQGDDVLFLVRVSNVEAAAAVSALPETRARLLKVVESAPDGVVVTDAEGHVLTANAAFLEMAQINTEDLARGALLGQWLGRRGAVDFDVLIANLRRHRIDSSFCDLVERRAGRFNRRRSIGDCDRRRGDHVWLHRARYRPAAVVHPDGEAHHLANSRSTDGAGWSCAP